MNSETKDLLKSVGSNVAGTVLGAGFLALIAFFAGKINFVVIYWKEILFSLALIFLGLTLKVWFRKLLKIEKQLVEVRLESSKDYSFEIKTVESKIKVELAKKADNLLFKDLQRTVKELQIFMHAEKGQMGELIGLVELLKEDIDNDSWRVQGTLEDLEKAIKGTNLKGDMITSIEEQLCRLGSKQKYNIFVNKVRKHYQD